MVPKQYCLAPCGTCDYIAPEILRAFEEEMVAFEADESTNNTNAKDTSSPRRLGIEHGGYGAEVDWWSLGIVAYELLFGIAPFFAEDVRSTYHKTLHHTVRS